MISRRRMLAGAAALSGAATLSGAAALWPETLMAAPDPSSRWSCYFEVEECDVVADKALALGGGELLRDDSPAGRLAFLTDPQGGGFCIIRSNPDFSM